MYTNFDNSKASGNKILSLEYDDVTGFVQTERYYTTDNGYINSEIDAISDQYDIRNRLVERDSRLFKWNLYYDDFHPIQTVAPHPNFNGNINSTKGYYKFLGSPSVQIMNDPGIFNFSIYDYFYDGLGRLVSADAELSSGPSTNSPPATAGDEIYNYDRIGNIASLMRNDIDGNVADDWTYSYQFGNNRLQEILNINTSLRSYTYDDNGNLFSDQYRNLAATKYGRSNLPFVLEMHNTGSQDFGLLYNYLYNINDQRIFKIGNNSTNGGEFYLRDSKGNEMAVFNLSQDFGNAEWTWYVNGSQRAMKYKANIGEQTEVLDPSTVTDFDEVDMLDQENLRIITGIQTSITAGYTLPDKLVKYRLANDTVFHYLLSNYLVYLMDHDSTFIVEEEQGSWQLEDQNSLVPLLTEGESGTRLTLVSIAEIEAGEGINPIYDESPFTLDPYYQPHTFHPNLTLANSQREYYIYDHLGNTRITYTPFLDNLSLTSYWLRNVYDYYPYGKILRTFSDGTSEKYLTTQHERDAETGLDYRFARFYDSDLGRFLGVDPLADHSNQVDKSTYSAFWNNPITYDDPDGQCPFCPWLDAVVDVGFVLYDVGVLVHEKVTTGSTSGENWAALGADGASILVPMSVGAGQAVKAGIKAVKEADNAADALNTADKAGEVMKNRVKLQKGTKEAIQDVAPKTTDGKFIDPNTGKPIEKGQEVYGHKSGQEWSKYKKDPANQGKTRKEVIKDQNDPNKYQIEDKKSNASHKHEEKPKK